MRKPRRRSSKPGPQSETLKLDGTWTKNVKRALAKKRPKRGWPKLKKTS